MMLNGDRRQSLRVLELKTKKAQQKKNQDLNEEKKAGGTKEHQANAATMPSENSLPERSKLQLLLDKLKRRDVSSIFLAPVNPEEVEDYYDYIKEPMDFGTITTKLDGGNYKSLQEFEHDITLVWSNAMLFNDSSTIYYREARAIRNLAKKLFNSLKTDPENFGEIHKTGSGGRRSSKYSEVKRPYTYRSLNTLLNENESIISAVCLSPQELGQSKQNTDAYREGLLQFVEDSNPTANTLLGQKLQNRSGESIKATPDQDTKDFSYTTALLGDESPEWDAYSSLLSPGSNLHQYQSIADMGSYFSNVEEAGHDWKRFIPTEAPPQPVSSQLFPPQSASAAWPSQWQDHGASTSNVKPLSLSDIDQWRLPQSTPAAWPSQWRDPGASTYNVKPLSLSDIDQWRLPQSTPAAWPSQWRDPGASTSNVKPLSLSDIDQWRWNH